MPFKVKPPLYAAWQAMKRRCYNPNNPQWNDYGGRGVVVCESWRSSYAAFAADMGPRPKGCTLDRRNNDGDYTPDNCRWATRSEQQRNQRVTRKIEVEGVVYLAVELAEQSGLKTDSIVERAARGLSLDEIKSPQRRVFHKGLALGGLANGKRQSAKTHCKFGHPFDERNTSVFRTVSGGIGRRCLACHAARQRMRNSY